MLRRSGRWRGPPIAGLRRSCHIGLHKPKEHRRLPRPDPHPDAHLVEPLLAVVREVAAREIMPRYLRVAHSRKADGSLFTEADLAAQDALKAALARLAPVPLLAEEMTQQEQAAQWLEGDAGLWCVDPIDGTSNFVNGLPYFAVSVALMRSGRPVVGVVYDPVADEAFHAAQGAGAYLNGERLPIKTHVPVLRNAMAGVDFKRLERPLAQSLAISPPYMSQRNYGASALEWCYAAAGRFDVYLHGGQRLWDYAAGALIMSEAEGRICSLDHDDFWSAPLWRRSVIAALDPALFDSWKAWLRLHAGGLR
jgi:myo-inositol-1(or 4)-monophosphatase